MRLNHSFHLRKIRFALDERCAVKRPVLVVIREAFLAVDDAQRDLVAEFGGAAHGCFKVARIVVLKLIHALIVPRKGVHLVEADTGLKDVDQRVAPVA